MRLQHLMIALPLALAGCHAAPKTVGAERAWIRLPAVAGRPAAAYLTVQAGAEPLRLIAVDADRAGSSELHESMTGSGMATMKRLDGLDVPAGGAVMFRPGGRHVMLFGLDPRAKPGDRATLTLRFAKGPAVQVAARMVGAGEAAPY